MTARNITQADLQKALGDRSKGYISDRVLGKRSWAISELDRIAHLFALPDALSLIAAAAGSAGIAESSTAGAATDEDAALASAADDSMVPDMSGWSADEQAAYVASHLDQFDIAAKKGDIEREQTEYEDLP